MPPTASCLILKERFSDVQLYRRHRSRHYQHSLHRVRPLRPRFGQRAEEHEQIFPKPGWVEHDPNEIWRRTKQVIEEALEQKGLQPKDFAAIGITNQRETTIVWNRKTGQPIYNAIVWQDTRVESDVASFAAEGGQDRFRNQTGLPLATYFSALKIRWILDNLRGARELAEAGELAFGNVDSYLVWNLTGGVNGGIHVTDVTNASRTQLMKD